MCECKRYPGKFEGEGALTALAYSSMMNGGADETEYDGDTPTDFFRAPFNFDADEENLVFAREEGFCEACIAEALQSEADGLALWTDSQGFVYLAEFATEQEYLDAIKTLEDAEEEEYV